MFFQLSASTLDPKRLRMRCLCGAEYLETTPDAPNTPPAPFGCPNCGRLIAVAYSVDHGPWQTYVQFRIEALQRLLQENALDEVPPEHRPQIRQSIQQQITQLQDGTWRLKLQNRIEVMRAHLENLPPEDRETSRQLQEGVLQTLQQELDAAGDIG